MSYTVWLDGTRIGETALELHHGGNRRGGIFHPTELGLSVLPTITAMGPALLDAGRLFRPMDFTDVSDLDVDSAAAAILATPEARRIMEAGELISRLEIHDPSGELVHWESLLISDMNELAAVARRSSPASKATPTDCTGQDPVWYFISAKLDKVSSSRRLRARGQQRMS